MASTGQTVEETRSNLTRPRDRYLTVLGANIGHPFERVNSQRHDFYFPLCSPNLGLYIRQESEVLGQTTIYGTHSKVSTTFTIIQTKDFLCGEVFSISLFFLGSTCNLSKMRRRADADGERAET